MEETIVAPQTISVDQEKGIVTVMKTACQVYFVDTIIALVLPLMMKMTVALHVSKSRIFACNFVRFSSAS